MKDDVNAKVTDLPPDEDLVLDPNHPMRTARRLVAEKFTVATSRTMHRHRGTFWRWDGACYREASQDAIADAIWKFLEHAKRQNEKGDLVDLKPDRGKVGNVRESLASVCFIGDDDDPPFWLSGRKDMPPAGEFFACANGLLHVPTGRLYPSTPDFFGVSASGVAYDESAEEPVQWLAFLKQVLEEEDAIMLLQDWMGYTLTPDTSLQKILLCLGPPRSGKGTVYRIQADLLGSNSVAGPTMSSLGGNFGLQFMITKMLAVISDARIGQRTDKTAVVERLLSISGEDAISVQRKFLVDWFGRIPTRLQILTNELPALTEGSGALANRYIILIFLNSFLGREDPMLTDKLRTELQGILNWAIVGYRRLRDRGHFVQPKNAIEQIIRIEMLGAPVKAFLRDQCVVGPGNEVAVDLLWWEFENWCVHTNRKEAGTKDWFSRNLNSAIPGLKTVRRGSKGGQVPTYEGVRLKTSAEEDVEPLWIRYWGPLVP